MEYTSLSKMPLYKDCNPLVEGLGYVLVELKKAVMNTQTKITAVITRKDMSEGGIGVDDCAKVHRLLFSRVEALLPGQDVYIEIMSPGMERKIKNAAEFSLFVGQTLRVWDREVSEWISGTLVSSCENSLEMDLIDSGERKKILYDTIAKAKLLHT